MAELASGAVSSLLGLLQKEARLLGRVGSDVEFIREEMESMNSFLEHLSRTAHLGGGHDKQVRTWMKQVRDLAHDCSNCVDNYLRSGDLAVHQARGGFRRYVWWTYWVAQKMIAQHRAALRLRELRDRVSDVGKRRLRYGVEVPGKDKPYSWGSASTSAAAAQPLPLPPPTTWSSSSMVAAAAAEDEEEEDDIRSLEEAAGDPRRRALQPRTLEDYCAEKLLSWLSSSSKRGHSNPIPSIAIVAPGAGKDDSGVVAQEALDFVSSRFDTRVVINLSALHHHWDLPLLPQEILYYIWRECHEQDQAQGSGSSTGRPRTIDMWMYYSKESKMGAESTGAQAIDMRRVFFQQRSMCDEIREEVSKMGVDAKIEGINSKIGDAHAKIAKSEKTGDTNKSTTVGIPSEKPLVLLYQALLMMLTPGEETGPSSMMIGTSSEEIIPKTANLLKKLLVGDEVQKPNKPGIFLDVTQYEDILRKVFVATTKPLQDQETSTAMLQRPTLFCDQEDRIKEILHNHKIALDNHRIALDNHKTALDMIQELLSRLQLPQVGSVIEEQDKAGRPNPVLQQVGHDERSSIVTDPAVIKETSKEKKMKESSPTVHETENKVEEMMWEINRQLLIKGMADKITVLKNRKTLISIIDDGDYISQWDDIRHALSLLGCGDGSAVTVITKNSQKAKEFCCPPGEPITCSLVGLYHDILLNVTSQRGTEAASNNNSQIFRDILVKCDPDESCMRMFAHALYVNSNRTGEELSRLNDSLTLQASENSTMATNLTNAKMIFKFSYRDLPREHKACLLYLAIFPQGYNIKRSKAIERWAIEELITKEDWHTVVHHAKRCFNALIDRCLVTPCDLSASGKVKSCMVSSPVHEFITRIASREHILDARLSNLRARHFSTLSGLQLRASDTIDNFVQSLPDYSHQLRLLKLLDLEGCQCLNKNYLKDICSMILRLKYLSLRKTNVDDLPREINNLHELEVLDIRQTDVCQSATRDILLLKLRRLLAGRIDQSTADHEMGALDRDHKSVCLSVDIPRKIHKMENMEVLSNVKASSRDGTELKEIRKLWQLSKLGVVINDNKAHLGNLLWAISDMKECLRSLSITISETKRGSVGTTPKTRSEKGPTADSITEDQLLPEELYLRLIQPPKVLESLSIDGFTNVVRLLSLFAKGSEELAKVTLSRTLLAKKTLMHVGELPKVRCIRLRYDAYRDSILTFGKQYFPHLKYFLAEWLNRTDVIQFKDQAPVELEKIVVVCTNIKHLCGVGSLPNLKELELKHNEHLVFLPKDGEPIIHEDGTVTKPVVHEDGGATACVDQKPAIVPEDRTTASAQPIRDGDSTLTFRKGEFEHLRYFLFEGSNMQTDITFEGGATPELEKIVLSCTNIKCLHGVGGLAKLREIELKADRTLSSFVDAQHIAKVTLSETFLKQNDIEILATKPKLCWLLLLENSYDDSNLEFKKAQFPKLKHLTVKCSKISNISFDEDSAPKLEKIIWSFTEIKSLSGIGHLLELKEFEFNGDSVPLHVRIDIHTHIKKPLVKHNKLQHQENKAK